MVLRGMFSTFHELDGISRSNFAPVSITRSTVDPVGTGGLCEGETVVVGKMLMVGLFVTVGFIVGLKVGLKVGLNVGLIVIVGLLLFVVQCEFS